MNNSEQIIFSIKIAVIAYTYSVILTSPGMFLDWWWKLLDKLIGKYPVIFKPIIDCYKCVAGQMILWAYIIKVFVLKQILFSAFELIYLICITIFFSLILNFIHDKVKET